MSTGPVDLLVVGGGPAGIAAAVEAAACGLSVMLLDENAAPGGRVWQAIETRGTADPDDVKALNLIRRFRASKVDARWNASVWAIDPDSSVFWNEAEQAHTTYPPADIAGDRHDRAPIADPRLDLARRDDRWRGANCFEEPAA